MGFAIKVHNQSEKKITYKTINLGTGTSINCKTHATLKNYYNTLTVNNFFYRIANNGTTKFGEYSIDRVYGGFAAPSISYNASTGILSASHGSATGQASWGSPVLTATVTCTTTKYCTYVE